MPEAILNPGPGRPAVRQSLWVAALYSALLLLIFHQTTWSIVSIWLRSETFAHGFLILPISLWLVWEKREKIAAVSTRPTMAVILLMLPLGFGWLVAGLVGVLVLQQLALVGMLIVGVWAILGNQLTWVLAFPLGFLFFAVPMGEALIPPMMEFTATSTVWMLQQTGIPVFREGLYFTLPTGIWSVVEACSGVRYLIASVTLGVLYAHLTYRGFGRRTLFVLASVIMPIFANTARAYIIVMLGHLSGMKIATGADHLIYGWVFFGIVIFLLFWVGTFFREADAGTFRTGAAAGLNPASQQAEQRLPPRGQWPVALVVLLGAGLWPLLSVSIDSAPAAFADGQFELSPVSGGWQPVARSGWDWEPGATVRGLSAFHYGSDQSTVGLYIQYPGKTDSSGEVVGSINSFVERDSRWRLVARSSGPVTLPAGQTHPVEAVIKSEEGELLAWSWYRIGGRNFSNDYHAKTQEGLASLGIVPGGVFRIVLATMVPQHELDAGRHLLLGFLEANLPAIDRRIDRTSDGE